MGIFDHQDTDQILTRTEQARTMALAMEDEYAALGTATLEVHAFIYLVFPD